MSYDVYYATGGGSMVYGGSDVWVNNWLQEVAPKLNHPSKLLIHRRKPKNIKVDFDSPIEINASCIIKGFDCLSQELIKKKNSTILIILIFIISKSI